MWMSPHTFEFSMKDPLSEGKVRLQGSAAWGHQGRQAPSFGKATEGQNGARLGPHHLLSA